MDVSVQTAGVGQMPVFIVQREASRDRALGLERDLADLGISAAHWPLLRAGIDVSAGWMERAARAIPPPSEEAFLRHFAHARLYAHIVAKGLPGAVILEDHACVSPRFAALYHAFHPGLAPVMASMDGLQHVTSDSGVSLALGDAIATRGTFGVGHPACYWIDRRSALKRLNAAIPPLRYAGDMWLLRREDQVATYPQTAVLNRSPVVHASRNHPMPARRTGRSRVLAGPVPPVVVIEEAGASSVAAELRAMGCDAQIVKPIDVLPPDAICPFRRQLHWSQVDDAVWHRGMQHVCAWRWIAEHGEGSGGLVVDSQARVQHDLSALLAILRRRGDLFEVLNLTSQITESTWPRLNDSFVGLDSESYALDDGRECGINLGASASASAYWVSQSGAKRLLNECVPMRAPIEHALFGLPWSFRPHWILTKGQPPLSAERHPLDADMSQPTDWRGRWLARYWRLGAGVALSQWSQAQRNTAFWPKDRIETILKRRFRGPAPQVSPLLTSQIAQLADRVVAPWLP